MNVHVVVSCYKEDVQWSADLSVASVIVYNKSGEGDNPLPNIGRESHTYLHHIVTHYDDLDGLYVFCQGNPFDHCRDFVDIVNNLPGNTSYRPLAHWQPISNRWGKPHHKHDPQPLHIGEYYEKYFGKAGPEKYAFPAGNQFAVSDVMIRSRPLEFYQRIYADLCDPIQTEELGYVMERLYGQVWLEPAPVVRAQATGEFRPCASSAVFFNDRKEEVPIKDIYQGRSAFLVCSGPSVNAMPLELLDQRGILLMGINNSMAALHYPLWRGIYKTEQEMLDATMGDKWLREGLMQQRQIRPHLWTSMDGSGKFVEQIFYDPQIVKFINITHINSHFRVRNEAGELVGSPQPLQECPNVLFWNRNTHFQSTNFLTESSISVGCEGKSQDDLGLGGCRVSMLPALKILYMLGVRTIYLLGCDFHMTEDSESPNYAFAQSTTVGGARSNNGYYATLNARFNALRPHFEEHGLRVVNTTPDSGLKSFETMNFRDAVREATAECSKPINTMDMYNSK